MTRSAPLFLSLLLLGAVSGAPGTIDAAPAGPTARPTDASPEGPPASAPAGAFAAAVVIDDGRLYIGAPGTIELFPMPANRPGAVHVFERVRGEWREAAVVRTGKGTIGDGFGRALAVAGDLLVVGAPDAAGGRGAAYVFTRSGATWREAAMVVDPAGSAGDRFGAAVAVAPDWLMVGAPGRADGTGAVVSFRRSAGGGWAHSATIAGPDEAGRFGQALALESTRALIGAPGPFPPMIPMGPTPEPQPGAVHELRLEGSTWTMGPALRGIEGGPGMLGTALVLEDAQLFASAPLVDGGMVLRYRRSLGGTWSVTDTLVAGGRGFTGFGMSMALAGDDLLVGAPLADESAGGSVVWVFQPDPATDRYVRTRIGGPALPMGFFGGAIGAEGGIAVVGAPGADVLEGRGYLYARDASGLWKEVRDLVEEPATVAAVTGEARPCAGGDAAGYDCAHVDLLSFLPVQALGGGRGVIVNDLWGWTDPETGREYGLVGRSDATVFLDVTDPSNPRVLGELPLTAGAQPNLWRDIKVYADHAFIVADGAGEHGMQVFDLRRLRNVRRSPVTFDADARYDGIASAHNLVMNEETGFAYIVGASGGGSTCGGGLHMVDVRDPLRPTFAGCFSDPSTGMGSGYSHDAQCVTYHGPDTRFRDHEICLGANANALSIADVTDKDDPVALAAATYPSSGFLHQGWLSDDHRYFFMNDETDELAGTAPRTRTLVWNLAQLDDPVLAREHFGTTRASDHNLYVRGSLMYQSNYVSGLRILDISDPENPREVGFFDTVPAGEDAPGFAGSWSNYPYFRSGNILVTSMREGLFIVKKRTTVF